MYRTLCTRDSLAELSQNPAAKHGRAVYWKGVANKNPHFSYIGKAYDKAVEAIKTGNFQGGVLYEYFPLDKVNAVPRSATAFRREMVNNVLINISWDGQAGDHTEEARTLSHEIADIINSAQSDMTVSESAGYSNYGQVLFIMSSGYIDVKNFRP